MATVRYKGHKPKMVVWFPIGVKSKSAIKEVKWADPLIEMHPQDAEKLVLLDPTNFEIVDDTVHVGPFPDEHEETQADPDAETAEMPLPEEVVKPKPKPRQTRARH